MKRVGLVTTATLAHIDDDLPPLLAALRTRGIDADAPSWRDPAVSWSGYDLLVIRSPWDYQEFATEFLIWLSATERVTPILNCPDLIRWNLDKRYLDDLHPVGIAVVPTHFCDTTEAVESALASVERGQLVVKPTVSAASQNTGRFAAGDAAALTLARAILALDKSVMIQPFVPSVAASGETALVYFEGEFSHAFRKAPLLALGGGLLNDDYIEPTAAMAPTNDQRAVADAVLRAVPNLAPSFGCTCSSAVPLYARIDLVAGESDAPLLLEAELFEPSYYVATSPGCEVRFADAVAGRLSRRT